MGHRVRYNGLPVDRTVQKASFNGFIVAPVLGAFSCTYTPVPFGLPSLSVPTKTEQLVPLHVTWVKHPATSS